VTDLSALLAPHYSRFNVAQRLLLTGHSHQAWPDVAREGQLAAFDDAARAVDEKWALAYEQADLVRDGYRRFLHEPDAELALGASTHDVVIRFLSALDLGRRPRLVTTDGEFHTLRRQLSRLAEAGIEVVSVPAEPADSLAQRLSTQVNDRTAAVLVSAVLFQSARIVPDLPALAAICATHGTELLVDAYHALGVVSFSTAGLGDAWVVGGGYKYLQLGEGNCFLRLPAHAEQLRPVVTGWYAEFGELSHGEHPGQISYAVGGNRFAGATYDPTSHYRAARVFDFFNQHGLTPPVLRQISLRQVSLLMERFDAIGADPAVIDRDRSAPREAIAGFLALRSPHAAKLQQLLRDREVRTDSRGDVLRMGPAPYLSEAQLHASMDALAESIAALDLTCESPATP